MNLDVSRLPLHQVGFVEFLIKPFFEEWTGWLGERVSREVLGHVNANLATWAKEVYIFIYTYVHIYIYMYVRVKPSHLGERGIYICMHV